jgi:hypothetical protein
LLIESSLAAPEFHILLFAIAEPLLQLDRKGLRILVFEIVDTAVVEQLFPLQRRRYRIRKRATDPLQVGQSKRVRRILRQFLSRSSWRCGRELLRRQRRSSATIALQRRTRRFRWRKLWVFRARWEDGLFFLDYCGDERHCDLGVVWHGRDGGTRFVCGGQGGILDFVHGPWTSDY